MILCLAVDMSSAGDFELHDGPNCKGMWELESEVWCNK